MSEWWTYSLTDFLLFSARTYRRLFELYNESVWPAHVAAFAAAIAILILLRRDHALAARAILATLSGIWLWIAWAFHAERYATINWGAVYFAGAFALQSLLLLWFALVAQPPQIRLDRSPFSVAAFVLLAFAFVAQPLIGPLLLGRDWHQTEVFGLAPDPTTVATLAVLCLSARISWLLFPIPLLWCATNGLTLWAMEAPDALVTPVAGALALTLAAWKTAAR